MIRMWASKRLMVIPGRMGVSILMGAIVVNMHVPLSNCKFPLLPKVKKHEGYQKVEPWGFTSLRFPNINSGSMVQFYIIG